MLAEPSQWQQFVELFRDPLLCALLAGGVLGFLSVYVVLRRMVFVSAAVAQSAGLGVALAFYAGIHLGFEVEPVIGATALALLATMLLMMDPTRLRLTRESLLGMAHALSGGAAILVGDRIAQESHDIQGILFGTAVLVTPEQLRTVAVAGIVSGVGGYMFAYFFDFPVGGSQTVVAALLVGVAMGARALIPLVLRRAS